jgi:hypothetical protein
MNAPEMRNALLEAVDSYWKGDARFSQTNSIIPHVAEKLGLRKVEDEQLLLTMWYDLFRIGLLSPGYDLANSGLPFCHLTAIGRKSLENHSRDPANPEGYMRYVNSKVALSTVAQSYVVESLQTYNAGFHKSSAVMLGVAAECLALDLRDNIQSLMKAKGLAPSKDMADWRIKRVLDAIETELGSHIANMPQDLREAFQAHWPAFTHEIRLARNDAGHPVSVDPVTSETAHANLILFPQMAVLLGEITSWAKQFYV